MRPKMTAKGKVVPNPIAQTPDEPVAADDSACYRKVPEETKFPLNVEGILEVTNPKQSIRIGDEWTSEYSDYKGHFTSFVGDHAHFKVIGTVKPCRFSMPGVSDPDELQIVDFEPSRSIPVVPVAQIPSSSSLTPVKPAVIVAQQPSSSPSLSSSSTPVVFTAPKPLSPEIVRPARKIQKTVAAGGVSTGVPVDLLQSWNDTWQKAMDLMGQRIEQMNGAMANQTKLFLQMIHEKDAKINSLDQEVYELKRKTAGWEASNESLSKKVHRKLHESKVAVDKVKKQNEAIQATAAQQQITWLETARVVNLLTMPTEASSSSGGGGNIGQMMPTFPSPPTTANPITPNNRTLSQGSTYCPEDEDFQGIANTDT